MNWINVGYDSANYYALASPEGYVLIDAGLPGTMKKLMHSFHRYGAEISDIRHLLVTHIHPDHCGIVQDLQQTGAQLVISDAQKAFIEPANRSLKRLSGFQEIIVNPHNIIQENDRDAFLERFGLPGYTIHTPGHSDDSISIVIEGMGIFIGDLPLPGSHDSETENQIVESWEKIRKTGEQTVFPAHRDRFPIAQTLG